MPILISCEACQAKLRVADDRAGKQVTCFKCGRVNQVPAVPLPSQIEPPQPRQPGPQPPPEPRVETPTAAPEKQAGKKGCLGIFMFGF